MAYSFDGVSRVITITSQTVMSVRDIYSRWVDWLSASDNVKFLPAFDTVGGNDIDASSGTAIPIYAFLRNGWKIRPQESSHTLAVNDGVLLVDGGGDPFVNPLGNFVVRINYQQPVQAITVSTGGGGGGLTPPQEAKLDELWKLAGLDSVNPMTVTPSSRVAGSINQAITGDGETTTTVTRQ